MDIKFFNTQAEAIEAAEKLAGGKALQTYQGYWFVSFGQCKSLCKDGLIR